MKTAMSAIGLEFSLAPAEFQMRGHDPELLRALQFESMADWLEALEQALQQPKTVGYDALTDGELDSLLAERSLKVPRGTGTKGGISRTDKIAALNRDDKRQIADGAQVGGGLE